MLNLILYSDAIAKDMLKDETNFAFTLKALTNAFLVDYRHLRDPSRNGGVVTFFPIFLDPLNKSNESLRHPICSSPLHNYTDVLLLLLQLFINSVLQTVLMRRLFRYPRE